MTVQQLIKKLSQYPSDMEVVFDFEQEIGWYGIEDVVEVDDDGEKMCNLVKEQ